MWMSKKGKACGKGCDCMNCANTNIHQTTTKIDDIDAIIEETLQEDPPHYIDDGFLGKMSGKRLKTNVMKKVI